MNRPRRSGVTVMMAVVALAVVSLIMGSIAWQQAATRRRLLHREQELQAEWLMRAGLERAAAKLLASPVYSGESLDLIRNGTVRVECTRTAEGEFRVTSSSEFPTDVTDVVRRESERTVRRIEQDGSVRVELFPTSEPAANP